MNNLWTVIGLLLTNAGFLFGMWKHFDSRITRVYSRLDEVKDSVDGTYVRKDTCQLLHTTTSDNLKGVECRINERFNKLEIKVEDSFKMIIDMLKNGR
jgi:hypothetical protein